MENAAAFATASVQIIISDKKTHKQSNIRRRNLKRKIINSLATTHPELAKEWHPKKNGSLTPSDVTAGSNKKVWWFKPYDDPITGRHFDFEWNSQIISRARNGCGCPYLAGKAVWKGYNDLATTYPYLALEWHPTRNKNLTPYDVTFGSHKKVWWYKPYDDPITGRHFEFEWEAKILNRTINDSGCPYLKNKAVWPGYNDLATTHPNIAKEWHPTKNGSLTAYDVTAGCHKKIWWFKPYDDPVTGRHFDFEWKTEVYTRVTQNQNCPYLSNQAVWAGYNDLSTTHPDLAKEWHPSKNGNLLPTNVMAGSEKRVWWFLSYNDLSINKTFGFEWHSTVATRTLGKGGCPYLTNQKTWVGYNDLRSKYPKIAAEWDPSNKDSIETVSYVSKKKYWWICSNCGNRYYTSVARRTQYGCGCQKCRR